MQDDSHTDRSRPIGIPAHELECGTDQSSRDVCLDGLHRWCNSSPTTRWQRSDQVRDPCLDGLVPYPTPPGIPPRFLPRVRWPRSLFTRVSSFESYKKSGNRVPRVRQSPPSVSLGESVNDSGELSKPWRMSTRRRNLHQCNIDKTRPIHFKLCSLLSSSHGTSA